MSLLITRGLGLGGGAGVLSIGEFSVKMKDPDKIGVSEQKVIPVELKPVVNVKKSDSGIHVQVSDNDFKVNLK